MLCSKGWVLQSVASFMLIFKQKHRSVTHSWSLRLSPLAQPPSSSSAPPAHTSVRNKKLTLYKLITDVSKLKRVSSRQWYDQRRKHLFWQPMTVIGSSSCRQRGKQQVIKKEKPVPLWEGGPLKFLTLFSFPVTNVSQAAILLVKLNHDSFSCQLSTHLREKKLLGDRWSSLLIQFEFSMLSETGETKSPHQLIRGLLKTFSFFSSS